MAHADPAGDLPTVALALDAQMVVAGPGGRRTIAAKDFFVDYFTTALAADEILVEVRIPSMEDGVGLRLSEVSPDRPVLGDRRRRSSRTPGRRQYLRSQDRPHEHGANTPAGIVSGGCARRRRVHAEAIAAAAESAADRTRPTSDQHADPTTAST